MSAELLKTPLHALHLEREAKMVEFAGYEMPVSYPDGIVAEHRQCRTSAALFDVSHMGQIRLVGPDAARALETIMPIDAIGMAVGQQRYGFFTDAGGGLLDDLMVTRRDNDLLLVVNADRKAFDTQHLITQIGHRCQIVPMPDRALLALQGPKASAVLLQLNPEVIKLVFMTGGTFKLGDVEAHVTRSGYTGEDGFEISVPADAVERLARALLKIREVKLAGLGARDTLRLEAGLCLYGHDIDTRTTPVHAGLAWAIPKVRRPGGERAGHYPGADVVAGQLTQGASFKRVGLTAIERVPVREGAKLVDGRGHRIGLVTSGTITPTVDKPIAMGYLGSDQARPQGEVYAEVREQRVPMRVTPLPFVPHRYVRTIDPTHRH